MNRKIRLSIAAGCTLGALIGSLTLAGPAQAGEQNPNCTPVKNRSGIILDWDCEPTTPVTTPPVTPSVTVPGSTQSPKPPKGSPTTTKPTPTITAPGPTKPTTLPPSTPSTTAPGSASPTSSVPSATSSAVPSTSSPATPSSAPATTPPVSVGDSLPLTGASVFVTIGFGALIAGLGLALFLAARRRKVDYTAP